MANDYFSKQADIYSQARPNYPRELFEYLADLCPAKQYAWDCATGNGQAAIALSDIFNHVIASDLSQQQLDNATAKNNIIYLLATAEDIPLEDHSIDLITVAQALHWFDHEKFYQQANRVLKKDGVIAAWCYSLPRLVNDELNQLLLQFYQETVGPYWPEGRHYIDEGYKTIPFPYEKLETPSFQIQRQWNCEQMLAYLRSWSACQRYVEAHQNHPVDLISEQFHVLWQDSAEVIWPIHLLVAKHSA